MLKFGIKKDTANIISDIKILILLIIISILLLFPFLGALNLFDWDEANFAELAREMILTKNYLQPQINYLPFFEKPPLFIWFQVISMKLFGINEFASRFPNALLGVIVIITLYIIGKREKNIKLGLLWVLTYTGSLLPFMYFRTGLIDPWFNYFMFMSLYLYYISVKEITYSNLNLILSALSLGLAVQTKGPAAFIIVYGTLGLMWIISQFKFFLGWKKSILWFILSLIFSSIWFIYETYSHGNQYIIEFIRYQIRLFTTEDALHGGPFYYHIIVLLLGCFPASFLLFNKSLYNSHWKNDLFKIMILCGLLVLILFSIVQTKIIHYSSMAYFPISYLAALTIYNFEIKINFYKQLLIDIFVILFIICLISIPILGVHLDSITYLIKDPQAVAQLSTYVDWNYADSIWGILVLIIYILLRKNTTYSIVTPFIITPLFILSFMIIFAPKIERYTQGDLIDFYKSKKGHNIDIQPLYLKSYACYFYSDKQPFKNEEDSLKHLYYLYYPIKRDVYFVSKLKDTSKISDLSPYLIKNGTAFYLRKY